MSTKEERSLSRSEKRKGFNPNENGLYESGLFGLPFTPEESELVILPVPWEATVSYGLGAAMGPEAVLRASKQLDLFDPLNPTAWEEGMAMLPIDHEIVSKGASIRELTEKYLAKYEKGEIDNLLQKDINDACQILKERVKHKTLELLEEDKIVGVLGGEHSVSLGYFEALAEKYGEFGILQIDAHADLRDAYEGLEFSHASIFFNALKIENLKKLVQAGIRDYSESERELQEVQKDKIKVFTDFAIRKRIFSGKGFDHVAEDIVSQLPQNVCISFDIDGLDPSLCPNTGTPVPGGFSFMEVVYLLEKVLESGRNIIGFDLVEVAPGKEGEWDGNVGARALYKLCMVALESRNKQEAKEQ